MQIWAGFAQILVICKRLLFFSTVGLARILDYKSKSL
jgi:hypothetical protein